MGFRKNSIGVTTPTVTSPPFKDKEPRIGEVRADDFVWDGHEWVNPESLTEKPPETASGLPS